MKNIKLTKSAQAIVDDEDFNYLNRFSWCLTSEGYAKSGNGMYMHRLLLALGDSKRVVDHINGDKLDNQKHNLRITNQTVNAINTNKSNGVSKYRGVYPHRNGKWCAQFRHRHIGMFAFEEDAAKAYIAAKSRFMEVSGGA